MLSVARERSSEKSAHLLSVHFDSAKSVIGGTLIPFLRSGSSLAAVGKQSSTMIYYTLDPQFGALLFSLYSRNERVSLFADPFASCSFPAAAAGPDVLSHAQSTLLQLLQLGQHYACFLSQGEDCRHLS